MCLFFVRLGTFSLTPAFDMSVPPPAPAALFYLRLVQDAPKLVYILGGFIQAFLEKNGVN